MIITNSTCLRGNFFSGLSRHNHTLISPHRMGKISFKMNWVFPHEIQNFNSMYSKVQPKYFLSNMHNNNCEVMIMLSETINVT